MKKQEQFSVGIYCRLSKDDIGSGDSSSIISQKSMLEKYVQDNGWTVDSEKVIDVTIYYRFIGAVGQLNEKPKG
jgi:DNA invertase Pin-like site-specific DNA recombinase